VCDKNINYYEKKKRIEDKVLRRKEKSVVEWGLSKIR